MPPSRHRRPDRVARDHSSLLPAEKLLLLLGLPLLLGHRGRLLQRQRRGLLVQLRLGLQLARMLVHLKRRLTLRKLPRRRMPRVGRVGARREEARERLPSRVDIPAASSQVGEGLGGHATQDPALLVRQSRKGALSAAPG